MTVLDPNMPTVAGAWRCMVSHQFTDMDLTVQSERAELLVDAIPYKPEQVFCSLAHEAYLQEKYGSNTEGIYGWCLEQQGMCDSVVFLIAPGPESTGMKKELDLAIQRKQKIIVCVHKDMENKPWVMPFLKNAGFVMGWFNNDDLSALQHVAADYF